MIKGSVNLVHEEFRVSILGLLGNCDIWDSIGVGAERQDILWEGGGG